MVGLEMGESECCIDPSHSPMQELDMTVYAKPCAMLKMSVHVTALHRVRSGLQHNELTCHAYIEAYVMPTLKLMSCKMSCMSCACYQLEIAAVKLTLGDRCYTWNAGQMGGQNTQEQAQDARTTFQQACSSS